MVSDFLQERLPFLAQALFEAFGAIAVAARPGLGAVPVAAIFAIVRVFDAEEVEIFFPVRTLLLKRRRAETGFDPMGRAVVAEASLLHVVEVFVAGDGALAERVVADGLQKSLVVAGFHASFDEIAHRSQR